MSSASNWPPAGGVGTKLVAREDAIFSLVGSTPISAPAAKVFSILVDTTTYPSWCSFVPRLSITAQPDGSDSKTLQAGTEFIFHVVMDPKKPNSVTDTHLKVTDVSTPDKHSDYIPRETLEADATYTADLDKVYRISWTGNSVLLNTFLHLERYHEIIITGPDSCEMRTWELMSGGLARVIKWMNAKTMKLRYSEWCQDLKRVSEKEQA